MCWIGEPEECLEIPLEASIVAYREWRVDKGCLRAIHKDIPWRRIFRADRLPTPHNEVGLWAQARLSFILSEVADAPLLELMPSYAIGSIEGWGQSVRHKKGWRFEKARILAVTVHESNVHAVKRRYRGLPVASWSELKTWEGLVRWLEEYSDVG
jgi:hypothetical protein